MTNAAAPGSRTGPGGFDQFRDRFRAWRQTRPFWGGVVAIIGGIEVYGAAATQLDVVVMQGMSGLLGMGVFLITVILGVVSMLQPHLRMITGSFIVVLGPISILAINLGGFVIGMILLVVGGALILAWAPAEEPLDLEYVSGARTSADSSSATATTQTIGRTEPASTPLAAPVSPGTGTDTESANSGAAPVASPVDSAAARPAAAAATVTPKPRPAKKSRSAPRTGLAGIFDVMFGTRRKPAPRTRSGNRPPAAGQRPAGKRPAGTRPNGTKPGSPKVGGVKPGDAKPASAKPASAKPASAQPASGTGSSGSASVLSSLPPMERPADPPSANARTWILIPMLLVALAAPGLLAGPAAAAPAPRSDGIFDWLFPPASPAPTPPPADPAPAPSPTPGFVLPTIPSLIPSPSPSPAPDATTPAAVAECPDAKDVKGSTSPGTAADEAAAAVKACAAAAEAADPVKVKAAAVDGVSAVSNSLTTLKASRMTMEGFSYEGVKSLDSPSGPVKVLHFKASSVAVEDMDQTYPFTGGQVRIQNTKTTSVLKGNVNLYVTSFKSNVFGLIPLTFEADGLQPPLVLPSMFFTDATSVVALVTCDQILIPTLKMPVTKS